MDKISVKEDPEFSRQHPMLNACRIEIVTNSGETKTASIDYPRGHVRNPMSDDELVAKFDDLARRTISREQVVRVLDALWQLDCAPDIGPLLDLCTVSKE